MRDRDVARSIVDTMERTSFRTRAIRRAQVVSRTPEGRYVCNIRGQESTFSSSWLQEIHPGTYVTLSWVDGALEISGPSAYSGGIYGS